MIYVTGDTHSNVAKRVTTTLRTRAELVGKPLTKDDYFIVCGDFGLVWEQGGETLREKQDLDWLSDQPFTTLFVDGNHENFDRLNAYTTEQWQGGKIHRIRDNILHLTRGQVFELPVTPKKTVKVFTFGGAKSHDIQDGVLDPIADKQKIQQWSKENYIVRVTSKYGWDGHKIPSYHMFRVIGETWWEQELPTQAEYDEGMANLDKVGWQVDYILTHDCSTNMRAKLGMDSDLSELNSFLKVIQNECAYRKWFFGHLHKDRWLTQKDRLLYYDVEVLED